MSQYNLRKELKGLYYISVWEFFQEIGAEMVVLPLVTNEYYINKVKIMLS
jgi:hypothetical protein